MTTSTWRRAVAPIALGAALLLGAVADALAHGTMIVPESRIHRCAFDGSIENHQDPACRAAIELGGKQAIYDWNGLRQGAADGRHREIIQDGELCGGGNPDFRGLNLARSDWRTTTIAAGADGTFELVWHATAPHATRDWEIYLTRDGWDPAEPLGWDDLDPLCTSGGVPLTTDGQGRQVYRIPCVLPARSGRQVLFAIWQRSDSPEAFYSCSDVVIAGGGDAGFVQIGKLRAAEKLPAGSVVTFRLFDEGGADLESIAAVIPKGQRTKSRWPVVLAREVNRSSAFARVGVLAASGAIVPRKGARRNLVYALAGRELRFEVDVTRPGGHPTYPAGIGGYAAGTVVRGSDGGLYECRPFPASGWCNQAPHAYGPVAGFAWADAWIRR